jgi:hypothetical protein
MPAFVRDQWLLPSPLAGCSSETGPSPPLDGRCFGKDTTDVGLLPTAACVFEQLPFPAEAHDSVAQSPIALSPDLLEHSIFWPVTTQPPLGTEALIVVPFAHLIFPPSCASAGLMCANHHEKIVRTKTHVFKLMALIYFEMSGAGDRRPSCSAKTRSAFR